MAYVTVTPKICESCGVGFYRQNDRLIYCAGCWPKMAPRPVSREVRVLRFGEKPVNKERFWENFGREIAKVAAGIATAALVFAALCAPAHAQSALTTINSGHNWKMPLQPMPATSTLLRTTTTQVDGASFYNTSSTATATIYFGDASTNCSGAPCLRAVTVAPLTLYIWPITGELYSGGVTWYATGAVVTAAVEGTNP